jgi:hypothetical protein
MPGFLLQFPAQSLFLYSNYGYKGRKTSPRQYLGGQNKTDFYGLSARFQDPAGPVFTLRRLL